MKILLTFILAGLSLTVLGTEQRPDTVRINKNIYLMHVSLLYNNPVLEYFLLNKKKIPFETTATNCSRGHIASYSIENDSIFIDRVSDSGTIYVDQIDQSTKKRKVVYDWFNVDTLFNQNSNHEKIFAKWFTGYLRIETIGYETKRTDPCDGNMMITNDSDEYTILKIVKGKITSKTTYDNLTFWALQRNCNSNNIPFAKKRSYQEYDKWTQEKGRKKKYWTRN